MTHRITRHYSAELQTAKQTLTTSKNSIEFTYSDFPCHLKVNRDKLVSISCLWKCRNGERLTITANSFTKIDQLDQGGKRPGGETGSPLLVQCVMRRRTGTSAPSALPVRLMAAKNFLSTNRKSTFLSLFLSHQWCSF